jgi:hypothetical protein
MIRKLRYVITLSAAALLLGAQALPTGAQATSTPNVVGMHAVYSVTSTAVSQLTAFATPSGGSTSISSVGAQTTTVSASVDSTVTAQSGTQLTVHSILTQGGSSQAGDYVVPLGAITPKIPGTQIPIPGGGVSFSESLSLTLGNGQVQQAAQNGQTDGTWFTEVLVSAAGQQTPTETLEVKLLQTGGPTTTAPGTALFLLPELLPPTELTQASGTGTGLAPAAGTGGSRTLAGPMAAGTDDVAPPMSFGTPVPSCPPQNISADSTLHTKDNHFVNKEVWYSHFMLGGQVSNGQFTQFCAEDDAVADSPLQNWWVLNANANFTAATTTSATATGQSDFEGIFPTFTSFIWQGHAYHQITLNLTNNQVWLTGEIDWYDSVNGIWSVWNKENFYTGQTYANGSGSQDSTWYVINCFAFFLC